MVRMTRIDAQAGGLQHFACSSAAWELLLELGQSFGWKPAGTTYMPARVKEVPDAAVRHDYRPGDTRDRKCINGEDALVWARALSEARHSPHLDTLLGSRPAPTVLAESASVDQVRSANAPFTVVMDEFIEYAFAGPFSFAGSD